MVNLHSSQVTRVIHRFEKTETVIREDSVAAEEPLELRIRWQENGSVNSKSVAVTMRTPGNDFELAAGFLFGEGVIDDPDEIADISYCLEADDDQFQNVVGVTLRPGLTFDLARVERNFYTNSSCGVCGKATLEALELQGCSELPEGPGVRADLIPELPAALRAGQSVFDTTGGLHAAGLFDPKGRLVAIAEDVGRHNALDKVIGAKFLADELPLDQGILMLSGRCSFELVQKALRARIPLVASVGAPSSLAIEVAERFGMTLAGFVRGQGFNVYCGAGRIAS